MRKEQHMKKGTYTVRHVGHKKSDGTRTVSFKRSAGIVRTSADVSRGSRVDVDRNQITRVR